MRRRVARERPPQRKAVQKAPEGAPCLQPLLRCVGARRANGLSSPVDHAKHAIGRPTPAPSDLSIGQLIERSLSVRSRFLSRR